MKIFHASYMEVSKPLILEPNRPLDFGTGFYLTNRLEQAENWCSQIEVKYNKAVINIYELDYEKLINEYTGVCFNQANKKWLDLILGYRQDRGKKDDFQYIEGEVADDKVFNAINFYLDGEISYETLLSRLESKVPNHQLCLKTQEIIEDTLVFERSYEFHEREISWTDFFSKFND